MSIWQRLWPIRSLLHWFQRGRGPDAFRLRRLFDEQRFKLQNEFFSAAAASGKPRGLRWVHCDWEPGVELAQDLHTGQYIALVGVTIQFEAVEGSDMEDLPAVGNLRNASGVYFFERGVWRTVGRTLFNVNPDEALARFAQQYRCLEIP